MHFKHLEGVFAVIILLTDTLLQTTEFQLFNSLKTKYQHCTVEKLTVSLICSKRKKPPSSDISVW